MSCFREFSAVSPPGSGSYDHFCPLLCVTINRWPRLSTHRQKETHSMKSMAHARPRHLCSHRMCFIAKRLGCVSVGTHVQQEDTVHFFGATPSIQEALFVFFCDWSAAETWLNKLTTTSVKKWMSSASFSSPFEAPSGDLCKVALNHL